MTAFAPDTLTNHKFLGGSIEVKQPRDGYRSGVDAVYLASSAPAIAGESVLDLGTGAGISSFCLDTRVKGLALFALEVLPAYASLAEQNAVDLGVNFTVYRGDVAAPPSDLRSRSFDGVIANPPYHRSGAGLISESKETAHHETVPLAVWVDCALRRLVSGGWLVMIQRVERLAELLTALEGRAGDIRIKPIAGRVGRPATRIVVKARKGARTPLTLCASLIEHDGETHVCDQDDYSAAAKAILRDGAALDF